MRASPPGGRGPRSRAHRRRSVRSLRAGDRSASFLWGPAPWLAVVPLLRLFHEAAVLGPLGCVVRLPHFIVEQLAAGVTQQSLQFGRRVEQASCAIEIANPL